MAVARGFGRWEARIRDGLRAMHARGDLPAGADPRRPGPGHARRPAGRPAPGPGSAGHPAARGRARRDAPVVRGHPVRAAVARTRSAGASWGCGSGRWTRSGQGTSMPSRGRSTGSSSTSSLSGTGQNMTCPCRRRRLPGPTWPITASAGTAACTTRRSAAARSSGPRMTSISSRRKPSRPRPLPAGGLIPLPPGRRVPDLAAGSRRHAHSHQEAVWR